jgi:hypothetical protein
MTSEICKGNTVGAGGCTKDVYAGGHCGLAGFHKFTKLAAQTVTAHSRPVAAPQGVADEWVREGGVKQHGAGQRTRTNMTPFCANALKGGSTLDAADQALRR